MPIAAGENYGRRHKSALESFFDRDAVMKAVDADIRKKLGWFGGYCRKTARSLLKDVDGPSNPGEPPHIHTIYIRRHIGWARKRLAVPRAAHLFKDSVLYSYDSRLQRVVIGPFLFNGGNPDNPVPAILEYGGTQIVKRGAKRERVVAHYRARPYMQPSFEKTIEAFRQRYRTMGR